MIINSTLTLAGRCSSSAVPARPPRPVIQSSVIGTSQAALTCGTADAQTDYSEFYSQSTKLWTGRPGPAAGFTPTNGAASAVLP